MREELKMTPKSQTKNRQDGLAMMEKAVDGGDLVGKQFSFG